MPSKSDSCWLNAEGEVKNAAEGKYRWKPWVGTEHDSGKVMNSAEKEIKFKEANKMTCEHFNSGYLGG